MKITLYIPQENNTFEPLEVNVDDNSYHYKEIMGDDNVVLNFSLADFMDIPVGTYFMYKDVYKYTLYSPENFKKNHSQHYDYTLTLESELAQLKTIKFKSFVAKYEDGIAVTMDTSPRLKFSFTGTPYEFAKLLADNLNLSGNETGWKAVKENCIQSERVTIDFNHDYCFDVLTRIAEAFNTEWDVEGREIRFTKVEKMKESAVKLSYGYKKGILGGIQRSQFDTSKVINRVWIQGGERNIRWDKYGNDTLLMPKNSTVRYDGAYFDDDAENTDKFDEEKAVEYRTDPSGCYVERIDRRGPLLEDSLDVSKVYPMREGTVTNAYENKDFWYFEDSGIPDTLDFAKCVLPDEKMTAIFQTGMLAGREFEVAYTHKKAEGEYIKRFQLIPREENGQTIPGGAFVPKTGDVYVVFHMDLPEEYVQDAERRARNEAIKYLYENAQPKYTYDWQLDGIYAKKQWGVSGGMLGCGNFVRFSDPQFLSEPVDIRITAVKTYIDRPQSPEITISNNVSGKSLASILNEIPAKEQEIERGKQEAINYAKRRWKDTQELIDNIKGITDEFENDLMSSLVFEGLIFRAGAPSLQYNFLDEDWITPVRAFIAYDEESKLIHVFDSKISHEVLQIDGHKPYWTVPEYMSDTLDPQTPYFLYIRASKTLNADSQGRMVGEAEFFISDKKIKLEDEEGNYIFWVAFLNSENEENERSIRTMYGYTELLPGQITADTLISSDGNSYMDFLLNQFKIGSKNSGMDWNISNKDTLSLTNAVIRNSLQVDDNAMIAGFKFYNDRIESSKEISNISSILLDGNSGAGHLAAKNIEWDENGDLIVKGSFQGKVVSKDDEGNYIEINATQKRINLYTFRGDLMGSWYYNSGKVGNSSELISRIFLRHIYYPENGEKVFQSQMTMSPSGIEFDMPLSHSVSYGLNGIENVGLVKFKGLPTSGQSLPNGAVWNDNGILKIVM